MGLDFRAKKCARGGERDSEKIQTDRHKKVNRKRGGGRLEREENFRNREIKRKKESETDRVTEK